MELDFNIFFGNFHLYKFQFLEDAVWIHFNFWLEYQEPDSVYLHFLLVIKSIAVDYFLLEHLKPVLLGECLAVRRRGPKSISSNESKS